MDNEIIESILRSGDIVDKALIAYVIWTVKNFSAKFDDLVNSVNSLNTSLAVSHEKHDTQEERIRDLEEQMIKQRERYHEIVNNNISQIQLNRENIIDIKKRLDGN